MLGYVWGMVYFGSLDAGTCMEYMKGRYLGTLELDWCACWEYIHRSLERGIWGKFLENL